MILRANWFLHLTPNKAEEIKLLILLGFALKNFKLD